MKDITTAELFEILRKHKMWLYGELGGERADLRGADLSEADLSGACLARANLIGAYLCNANLARSNLYGAYLCNANLVRANLIGAYLIEANLSEVNLSEANLSGAYLYGANLYGANLVGAKNLNIPIACPEKGPFTAFKKVSGNYIVELEVPTDALRSSACSRKCRCSHAKVISFTNLDGSPADVDVVYSNYDSNFAYRVGEIVSVDNFDTNRWNECAPGIHFFITRQEAVDY